ncbi:barstar family protein [Kribbella sp. NPDC051620]|uniref:barstar family protein n=1 Tax=Kribbella sp. NPDC051620 TaxID=3364120 RepID=UPI0037B41375
MQVSKHTTWPHALPLRYLLAEVDADDQEHLWASCAAAEGLFVEPSPVPREVLALRGFRPEDAFMRTIGDADNSHAVIGDLAVEVWDEGGPQEWWTLKDVAVLAQLPDPDSPGLYDLVVGAGVVPDTDAGQPPKAPRFELFAGGRATPGGQASTVDGLFKSRPAPVPVPLKLIGCEPTELLLAAVHRPRRARPGWGHLVVLDRDGAVMAAVTLSLDLTDLRPSVLGGTLVDITMADGGDERPSPAVRPIWDRWHQGPATEPNLWAPYDSAGRTEWIGLTTRAWRIPAPRPDRSGAEYHLDGRFVTDAPGLHCAMAEALLGPGFYFGREWNAFKDCLCGGFGVVPPFTLNWHDSDVARQAFAGVFTDPAERLTYFEEVVRLLERNGVSVVLR